MRVWINGVDTKWVKLSLPDSASNEEVIGNEEYEDPNSTFSMHGSKCVTNQSMHGSQYVTNTPTWEEC